MPSSFSDLSFFARKGAAWAFASSTIAFPTFPGICPPNLLFRKDVVGENVEGEDAEDVDILPMKGVERFLLEADEKLGRLKVVDILPVEGVERYPLEADLDEKLG